MEIDINQITSGIALRVNEGIYLVTEFQHVKPGKGSAFVRVKLKNVKTDAVLERTYRSSERLEEVTLEERELEYLYQSGETYHFMDHTTYEEVALPASVVGDGAKFLLEGLEVTGLCHNHQIFKVVLPNFIVAQILESEPGIRGDSSRSGGKPAKIQSGATIQVPLFINVDDWVKIDTRTGTYVERVQK
ncbi:MAG: elongation factor P [Candidatus Omnitrophica bacterium]|nr:elongation factor P [Candidatus Omnitrophota bacterium]